MTQIHFPKPCTWPVLTLALVDSPTVLHPTVWSLTKQNEGASGCSACTAHRDANFNLSFPALTLHLVAVLPPLFSSPECCPFSTFNHWLRKCDPVCLLPHPLWKECVCLGTRCWTLLQLNKNTCDPLKSKDTPSCLNSESAMNHIFKAMNIAMEPKCCWAFFLLAICNIF